MSTTNFNIRIYCMILTTDIPNRKQYVLSVSNEEIIPPNFLLESQQKHNIEMSVVSYLKQYIYLSDIELLPQLICLNSKTIESDENTINCIYGFLVNHTNNINNSYWIKFDHETNNQFSPAIFETIQRLR